MQSLIMTKKVNREKELKEAKEYLDNAGEIISNPIAKLWKKSTDWLLERPKRMAVAIVGLLITIGLLILWFTYIQPTLSMLNDTNKNITMVAGMLKERKVADSMKRIYDSASNQLIINKLDEGFKNVNGNLANMINYNNSDFKKLIEYIAKKDKDKLDLENDIINDHNFLQRKIEDDALKKKHPLQELKPHN